MPLRAAFLILLAPSDPDAWILLPLLVYIIVTGYAVTRLREALGLPEPGSEHFPETEQVDYSVRVAEKDYKDLAWYTPFWAVDCSPAFRMWEKFINSN